MSDKPVAEPGVGPLVRALSTARPTRVWRPLVSVATPYSPCGSFDSVSALRCPSETGTEDPEVLVAVARRASDRLEQNLDPDAVHALALIDLFSTDESGKLIDRSISYLEMLTQALPRSASAYADLSAARLASSAGRGGARALLGGLDAASRALELDPNDRAALFNRALASDILGLNGEAMIAWNAYLQRDSSSAYAGEARTRLKVLSRFRAVQPPDSGQPPAVFASFAKGAPAEARALALESLLPSWGERLLAVNVELAKARLAQASAIGAVLASTTHDSLLHDALSSIEHPRNTRTTPLHLARLHIVYARSQRHAQQSDYPPADSGFLSILADRESSRALTALAGYGHANAMIYRHMPREALRAADSLLSAPLIHHYQIVAARTLWIRGLLLLRAGKSDDGLASVHQARALYEALGERDNVASAIGMEGEMMLQLGSIARGYEDVHRAAEQLRSYPFSLWRHNALLVLARASVRSGFPYATRAIEDEDMRVVGGGTRATSVVEARLARARSAWVAGRTMAADTALNEALRALTNVADPEARDQLTREVDLTIATRLLRSHPDSARVLLDSVVAFFAPLHFPMKLIPALISRASIGFTLRDTAAARRDLDRAAVTYIAARSEIAAAAQGAALLAQAGDVFNALIMLQVGSGKPNDALSIVAKSRNLFARSATQDMTTRTGRRSLVTYALVADTLMTWLVTGSDTVFQRATIDGRAFANTMSLVRSAMEVGTRESAVVPHLERLYDLLIRPIEPRLAANGSLIVAADGPIANVPFAALRDSKRRQYLVERLTIQFASGGRTSEVLHGPSVRRPVFVADPQVVGSNFANLAPLAAAATEGAAAAALYPNATLLRGTDADSSSVVGALQQADLFHFAGHAVLDDVEPERSYLVIGSRGLNAGAIANLRLPQLKLVVLSACETIRSTQSATGGFFGLAEAFFAAGARGVIGSLWRVDDAETRTLMQDFHRSYARTGDAARALQTAQIAAIRAGARSPSAWSGFRYAGF